MVECVVHLSSGSKWQVECSYRKFVIDLEDGRCACKKWELTGILYLRAMAVIRKCRNEIEGYVDNCYTIDSYLNYYRSILNPINKPRLWPKVNAKPINLPKRTVNKKG